MIKLAGRKVLCLICVLVGLSFMVETAVAGPPLQMPDGKQVEAADLPFFRNRPKVVGFLETIVNRKLEGSMALAATPAFCPSYSWTAWGGEDPVSRVPEWPG